MEPVNPSTRPRHQQLAEALFTEIASGHLAIGDRLPTEHELSQTHGLARGTVRAALAKLEDLGMIDRTPKRGTIVVAPQPVGPYRPVATSPSDIVSLATNTRLVAPRSAEITLPRATARRVGAPAGSRWFLIEGPRATRQRPHDLLCWSEHYLRHDLPRDQLVTGHFTIDQVAAHHVTQTIAAALLDEDIAAALDATPGAAALVITRTHRDDHARLVAVGIHTHPADRFQITTTINQPVRPR
jgi:DNA-binding GntR family transcriptional regulator